MLKVLERNEKIKPAFACNYIAPVFASDDKYIAQTAVMVESIISNSSKQMNYDIIVLCESISDTNIKNVLVLAENKKNISIRFFGIAAIIGDIEFYTDSVYTPTKYAKAMYFRLFIPFLMPDYMRAVYFDGDMTALRDISPLAKISLDEKIVGATRDYSGIAACYDKNSDRREYRLSIGIKNLDNYFISSLVIFDIFKFNEKFPVEHIKSVISERDWRQQDQDILNVLCGDSVKIINAEWSFFEELDYSMQFLPEKLKNELKVARENPYVMHYAAERKAWIDGTSDLIKYFWLHAAKTRYFDVFNGMLPANDVARKSYIFYDVLKRDVEFYYTINDLIFSTTPYFVGKLSNIKICIEFLDIKDGVVSIDGYFEAIDKIGILKLYAICDGVRVPVYNSDYYRGYGCRSKIKQVRNFNLKANIRCGSKIEFMLTYDDIHLIRPSYISVEQFAPLNENKYSFYCREDFIVTKRDGKYLCFEQYSRHKRLKYNHLLCKNIKKRDDKYFKYLAAIRWIYTILKPFMRKKHIWLISGKDQGLSDDLLAFANYMKNKGVAPYVVVDRGIKVKGCRVKKIRTKSKMHKLLFLYAEGVIGEEYNIDYFLPCFNRTNEVRDIIANKKFIIWKGSPKTVADYVKPWYAVNCFITDNMDDYNFILDANNGYSQNNVIMIGNSKDDYDALFDYIRRL